MEFILRKIPGKKNILWDEKLFVRPLPKEVKRYFLSSCKKTCFP